MNGIRESQIQRIKKLSTVKLDETKGSCKPQQKIVKVATKTGYLSFDSFFFYKQQLFFWTSVLIFLRKPQMSHRYWKQKKNFRWSAKIYRNAKSEERSGRITTKMQ